MVRDCGVPGMSGGSTNCMLSLTPGGPLSKFSTVYEGGNQVRHRFGYSVKDYLEAGPFQVCGA